MGAKRDTKTVPRVQHVKSIYPTMLNYSSDADLAEEAVFHAVEEIEKRAVEALREEVDFLFGHPGDVRHGGCDSQVLTKVKAEVKEKSKKVQEASSKSMKNVNDKGLATVKAARKVVDEADDKCQRVRRCLEEMMMGNVDE